MATTILKPGGYQRLLQMVEKVEALPFRPSPARTRRPSEACPPPAHGLPPRQAHQAPAQPQSDKKVPWLDCFTAPCKGGCPIEQDIPEYMELGRKGLYGPP